MGAGRTLPTTAPAEPSRLPSMEGAPSTGERAVLLPLGQLVAAGWAVHGRAGARCARRRASQGRVVHGGAGRSAPAGSGQDLLPVRRARPRESGAPALGPAIGIALGENSRGTPSGESSLPTHSPMARTRVPPAPGESIW